ncbi:unnamed protein product [Vicia faba]|uniref:Transmembrane protein n=1 Tax=Vicia faba TaxID=3906 RepID=A0AAV1A6I3_VICFA|nr:unnamed protein product [Vicia faba]
MSNKSTGTMVVTTTQQPQQEVVETPKKPFIPFFPNFNFNFKLPPFFFPPKRHHEHRHHQVEEEGKAPNVVTFPKTEQSAVVVPAPLQAQPDSQGLSAKTSDPFKLYQIYAVGAFLVSSWIWARWNERKARGRSPNDEDDGTGSQENE